MLTGVKFVPIVASEPGHSTNNVIDCRKTIRIMLLTLDGLRYAILALPQASI